LLLLALMGAILFWLLEMIERFTVPWHASQREAVLLTS
jgi:NitT/TauT family transport system permease protein